MNKFIIAFVMVAFLSACGPKYKSSDKLNITPGVGIVGVVEIGMTHADVRRSTRDLVVQEFDNTPECEYEIPSLGISWQSGGVCSNDPLGIFKVFVGPCRSFDDGAVFSNRFSGWLNNDISFTNGNLITRNQIESLFGKPINIYDLRGTLIENRTKDLKSVLGILKTNHQSSAVLWPATGELITYPQQGIYFQCLSNVVFEIGISNPVEQ